VIEPDVTKTLVIEKKFLLSWCKIFVSFRQHFHAVPSGLESRVEELSVVALGTCSLA
jgi:hypothetical protein